MQALRGTASNGTPQVKLAALVVDIIGDKGSHRTLSILTPGQQAWNDLCKKDLEASRQAFEAEWSMVKGQQFLVDLRRMEKTLHKILAVQGDVPHLATNVYVVAQALTSILTNPRNMCFGNAVFRCWSWAGAHAEDQSMAWGRTHDAVRQFLSDNQPSLLQGLDQMQNILQHFQEGSQADVGDFAGHLWAFAASTFFGGKFLSFVCRGPPSSMVSGLRETAGFFHQCQHTLLGRRHPCPPSHLQDCQHDPASRSRT